jgi:anti-sigma factor RsiW
MSCDQSINIARYHDGELSPTEISAVEAHLLTCSACRVELQSLRTLSQTIHQAKLQSAPASAIQNWTSLARARKVARANQDLGVRRLAEWLTAAAALLLIASSLFEFLGSPVRTMTAQKTHVELSEPAVVALDSSAVGMDSIAEQNHPYILAARLMATDLGMDEKGIEQP